MYRFIYLILFTYKLEPTELQDVVKKPNFEFPPPPLSALIERQFHLLFQKRQ